MPQRKKKLKIIKPMHQGTYPEDVRPLERMHFFDMWERMNWFIQVAQKPVDELSQGEILSLQEEIRAAERVLFHNVKPTFFTIEKIKDLQAKILEHIERLSDEGSCLLGPFKVSIWVARFRFIAEKRGISSSSANTPLDLVTWYQTVGGQDGLIYEMGRLLSEFGDSFRRCPHCSKIFLQLRKNAVHCGRKCQSIAVMREKRKGEKERTIKVKGRKKSKSKGGKDGTIRRQG